MPALLPSVAGASCRQGPNSGRRAGRESPTHSAAAGQIGADSVQYIRTDGDHVFWQLVAPTSPAVPNNVVCPRLRVSLMRVVADKQMLFALNEPNAKSSAAMAEADEIARTRRARFGTAAELFDDLEKNSRKQARPTAASGGLCC